MKIIAKIKLMPDTTQAKALIRTLEAANLACNKISVVAWKKKLFQQISLHKIVYRPVRDHFDLSAQMTVRCIAKVVDAYKLDKETKREFKKHGSIAYDSRILTYFTDKKQVSIWLLGLGRVKMSFQAGKRQMRLLQVQQGESDLIYRKGEWYLHAVCNIEEPDALDPTDAIGVDLGVQNIAVTSDGEFYTSDQIESTRQWYSSRRAVLQSVGTKSAKRRLRQISKGQSNFQRNENHRISKSLVKEAKRTKRGIALEDLTGINTRTRVRKASRSKRMNWSFFQLRSFIGYKAKWAGVPVYLVDPAYTSQRCNRCGHISRKNRQSQDKFCCQDCGYRIHADLGGAKNIRGLGRKIIKGCRQPTYGSGRKTSYKPLPLGRGS
jgi:IS605 OrfB family transposase